MARDDARAPDRGPGSVHTISEIRPHRRLEASGARVRVICITAANSTGARTFWVPSPYLGGHNRPNASGCGRADTDVPGSFLMPLSLTKERVSVVASRFPCAVRCSCRRTVASRRYAGKRLHPHPPRDLQEQITRRPLRFAPADTSAGAATRLFFDSLLRRGLGRVAHRVSRTTLPRGLCISRKNPSGLSSL